MAEMLENVDLGAVGVGRVGGKHPERGEEALRSDQLQARLDIAVRGFVEIVGSVIGTRPRGRQQSGQVGARAVLAGAGSDRRARRFRDEVRSSAADTNLGRGIVLSALIE